MAENSYGYPGGGTNWGAPLGQALARIGIEHRKKQALLDTVQGYLNVAKTLTVNDPKNGKPKPFFTPEQLSTVQNLVNQGKAAQAGAAAAAFGIGKNVAANVAKANAMSGNVENPIRYIDGIRYIQDAKGKLTVDTGVPRNKETGQTTGQQVRQGLQLSAAQQRTISAAQKGTASMLKQHGITATDLFDPSRVVPGTVKDGSFTPYTGQPTVTSGIPEHYTGFGANEATPTNAEDIIFGGATTPETPGKTTQPLNPTHLLVGAQPPSFAQKPGATTVGVNPDGSSNPNDPNLKRYAAGTNLDASGKPTSYVKASDGKSGALLTNEQFQSFQDQAAKLDPSGQGVQALRWLRNPENIKQDPQLANQVRQKLADSITTGQAYTVPPDVSASVESGTTGQSQAAPDTTDTADEEP